MGEPPEGQLNGVVGGGGPMLAPTSETVGSKRQRRPSVRLGDIGGDHHQPYDSHGRRTATASNATKQFKHHLHMANVDHKKDASKSSKIRALTNLNANSGELNETLDENLDSIAIGSWKVKDSKKRGSAKRVRTNWISKNNESAADNINKSSEDVNNNFEVGDSKYSGGEDMEDGYRDFDMENSDSPLKEHSPVHSLENLAIDGHERDVLYYNRRGPIRGSRDHNDGVELSGPSDNDAREWNRGGSEDGVRIWLNSLGLGRYAPVFEVHEVDDEVLPMLTLEDLKDMGINAVGSRRKMYCAIQKLGKGFS
ncbi:putative Sterile alpha motif domain-containing protein [Melia azedarach]|uniref:Sterile alpha motif domain-containing protein n=2 Tax=Melia azedarach TaxID=155640 RepID=A0ACC1YZG3_MELAZ|nr:putative Sterile alpha motif domain-containing protein [Melia azedarach]KAJ4728862.1 putative Sterile alpha motif domain-containing protein [Melia azedarach]